MHRSAQAKTAVSAEPRTAQSQNHILAGLPPVEFRRLSGLLTRERLEQRQPIWEPNRPIEKVHFPTTAVVSILALTQNEGAVEVGTIGNEGFVGLPVFLGAEVTPSRAIVQITGDAEVLETDVFRREMERDGPLGALLHRYTQGFMTQVSQSTACNRMHSAEQRLSRWLLVVRDRVRHEEFPLTHEFLGQMLGVRRATVTETAGALQAVGLITYSRGVIKILDHQGLENAACECYRIVRDEFERLLGVSVG